MTPPPLLRADRLWRQLARAQDAALERDAPPAPVVTARRRLRVRPLVAASLLTLGAAAAAVALFVHRAPLHVRVGQGGATVDLAKADLAKGDVDRLLVADTQSDLPLQFSDGSSLTFRAGSSGRMHRLGGDGAEVALDSGRLEARVVHADKTLWLVHAGPYRVRVTGTRFAVVWESARLDVALFEGSVMIDGAVLGAGVPLRAGQRLTVDRGVVRTEALAATVGAVVAPAVAVAAVPAIAAGDVPAPGEAPPAAAAALATGPARAAAAAVPAPTGSLPGPVPVPGALLAPGADATSVRNRASDGDWYTLAKQSAYVESFAAAKRAGWARLCHHLDAHRLLTLGDVARYAGAHGHARQAFESLVRRFPRSPLAADAVFSLGRLAFESDHSDRAAHWFRRYVADWPHGPLADQAVGRLLECALHTHDTEAARGAARAYLARAPGGPHARLARLILRDGVGNAGLGGGVAE